MNFAVTGSGIGLLGGWALFGLLMIVFTIVVAIVIRLVRGRDDRPTTPGDRAPEDDYIL